MSECREAFEKWAYGSRYVPDPSSDTEANCWPAWEAAWSACADELSEHTIQTPVVNQSLTTDQCPHKWQPIETAPRDGSTVLLRGSGDHRIADGYWLKEAYDGNGAWIWAYVRSEPSYWMPLPEPPA